MYPIGEIDPKAQKLIDVTKECLRLGLEECKPGSRFGNIGYAISEYAHSVGDCVVYEFCGHGVGVKVREERSGEGWVGEGGVGSLGVWGGGGGGQEKEADGGVGLR